MKRVIPHALRHAVLLRRCGTARWDVICFRRC